MRRNASPYALLTGAMLVAAMSVMATFPTPAVALADRQDAEQAQVTDLLRDAEADQPRLYGPDPGDSPRDDGVVWKAMGIAGTVAGVDGGIVAYRATRRSKDDGGAPSLPVDEVTGNGSGDAYPSDGYDGEISQGEQR